MQHASRHLLYHETVGEQLKLKCTTMIAPRTTVKNLWRHGPMILYSRMDENDGGKLKDKQIMMQN